MAPASDDLENLATGSTAAIPRKGATRWTRRAMTVLAVALAVGAGIMDVMLVRHMARDGVSVSALLGLSPGRSAPVVGGREIKARVATAR